MEKKIEFESIIAFIEKAMKNNLNIRTSIRNWDSSFEEIVITIYDTEDSNIYIQHVSLNDPKNYISISKGNLNWVKVEVSEMDMARFKVEALKAQEYSKNKVIEYFNNFIKKSPTLTDINDLDNEDD